MAHFAEIDKKSIVIRVVVVADAAVSDKQGDVSEALGQDFLKALSKNGTWLLTFIDGGPRKNYAGVGFTYNADLDAYVSPRPYQSWLLDKDTCLWMPPVPYPGDGAEYHWNEETQTWDKR